MPSENQSGSENAPQSSDSSNNASSDAASVHTINTCKLPPFWKPDARLWFLQVESIFSFNRITTDNSRYNYLVSSLDGNMMTELADFLMQPPESDKYEQLKALIIKRFTETPDRQLHRAMSELVLEDKKPSQLLHQMTRLAGGRASSDVLRVRWLSLLPQHVQRSLKVLRSASIEELTELADELMEDETGPFVMATSRSSGAIHGTGNDSIDTVKRELKDLKDTIASLQKQLANNNNTNAAGKQKNSQPVSSQSSVCYYHKRYGINAQRCAQPCSWVTQQGN